MALSNQDRVQLQYAKTLLENPGVAAMLTNAIGTPIERGFDYLPEKWSESVRQATSRALHKALQYAIRSMGTPGRTRFSESLRSNSNGLHKTMVAVSGAGGGAFGLPALAVELPVSTMVMLRSIADIARSEGEQIHESTVQLDCMQVFALGGPTKKDDATESGYFAVRTALARSVSEAAQHVASHKAIEKGAPTIVRFLSKVSARFGVTVSKKVAAQAVPVIGAAGGATINLIFIDHFQKMARGHFIVRRLERTYGSEIVRAEYDQIGDLVIS